MNDPLYLEDLFGNLARVRPVFNEEKIQEQMGGWVGWGGGGYVVSKCKEDEFEGVGVTNFGYPLAMNLLEKKQDHQRTVLKLWSTKASCSERIVFFTSLPSRRLC